MSDADPPRGRAGVPPPPKLPDLERPSPEEVIDGVPSTSDVVDDAQSADDIVGEQPTVDELLGDDHPPG